MKKLIRLTTVTAFAFFCAGSFLIASDPSAEWTFRGEKPLEDVRGGIKAMQSKANLEGTVMIKAGEVLFAPRTDGGGEPWRHFECVLG